MPGPEPAAPARRILVLHGLENRRPPEHWQHWLAERLRGRGEQVLYPQLPDPDAPDPRRWLEVLEAELGMLGSGERVVVCHSLACTLWLRLAASGRPVDPVDRVLLVCPPAPEVVRVLAPPFAAGLPRPAAVRALARETLVVGTDGDPCNPAGARATLADPLGLPCREVPGGGHLTPADGFGPWPAAEAWCTTGRLPGAAPSPGLIGT